MSGRRVERKLSLAFLAAIAGCGNSSPGSPLGIGGGVADAATPEVAAADVASAEAAAPLLESGASESSVPDEAEVDEASAALDAAPDLPDTAPDADLGEAGAIVEGGTTGDTFACDGPGSRYITDVVSFMFGDGQNFGQNTFPANILGPPKGSGSAMGSLDVVSLGNGGSVTVAFAGNEIVDGPGPDFIVFENAFDVGGDPNNPFAELGIVAVSQDGTQWYTFPCTATQYPYGTCAGWHPVFANPDQNSIDPTDPATAGGDPFDLADLGLSWARYVRVTDRPDDNNVFDLDAVAIVHPRCP